MVRLWYISYVEKTRLSRSYLSTNTISFAKSASPAHDAPAYSEVQLRERYIYICQYECGFLENMRYPRKIASPVLPYMKHEIEKATTKTLN